MYDICIIGGGLGGLTLSIQMVDLGWKVLLIEKKNYPFHRVCGEYIAQESWDFLSRIGFDSSQFNLPIINQLKVSAPNGQYLTSSLTTGGIGISRYLIDQTLFSIAKEKGVEVLTKTSVQSASYSTDNWDIKTNKSTYKAKAVVGAYGKRSNLDQQLNRSYLSKNDKSKLKNFVAVKYHLKGDFVLNQIELHNFEGGYCGLSKVENDILCMCYLVSGTTFNKEGNIDRLEKNILQENPFLKKYLQYERLWERPLSIAQVDFSKKDTIENGLPLIGDAAGLIAPLCGNGMSMSMHASAFMASNLHLFLEGKQTWEESLKAYENFWKEAFKTRLTMGRVLQRSFGKKGITNLMISLLQNTPSVMKKVIQSTHGQPF